MATKPSYQPVIDTIEQLGAKVTHSNEEGKHVKIYFTTDGNVEKFYVTSKTPSDRSLGLDNVRRDVRRLLDMMPQPTFKDIKETESETETKSPTTFGEKLRKLREQRQMTRERLAELTQLNPELIEHFEILPEQPFLEYETVLKLSTALGTTLSYLASGKKLEGEPNMSELAERVKARRNELGLTIGSLAARTGIPNQLLANLETGTFPDFYRLEELAKGLECSEEYLKTGKKELKPMPVSQDVLDNIKTIADFGKFVADRRYDLNLTQKDLAKAFGHNYATDVSKAERGINISTFVRNSEKLADLLELPREPLKAIIDRVAPNGVMTRGRLKTSTVVFAPASQQAASSQLEDVLAAIRVEGRLTRELLQQQHKDLLESIKTLSTSTQSQGLADILHTMIDNLLGKR